MKKILLCDDSMLIRVQLKNFFSKHYADLTILEAANGNEAFDLYEKERPDLVIMDIVMPEVDGLECLQKIKIFDETAKVIVLSSVGNKEILKDALKAGAVNFLQKPWSEDLITKAIKPYID